jgi:hypothetical protein
MMSFNKIFLPLYITTFLILTSVIPIFSQEVSGNEAASDATEKPAIILVPLGGEDVPSYIPMIVDRLFEAKIDKTEAYSIFTREELAAILKENDIILPESINEETALKIGERLGMDQVLFGVVTLEDSDFVIKTKIMDVETGTVISKNTERSKDIKGLEGAVGKLTRSIVQTVLPEEVVAEAVQTLDAAEQTDKEADVQDSISAFEKLAEEDPEQALEMVGEPAREAIRETVREEIVEEEIQILFEEDKAEQALIKKRKKQFWTMVSLEGAVQLGNIMGSMAAEQRIDSISYWNYYMNIDNDFSDDSYQTYKDRFKAYQGLQFFNYLFTGGSNLGLTASHRYFLDDVFMFSDLGRQVFAISYVTQFAGYAASTLANQLGFWAQRKYLEYSMATDNFTEQYEAYRDVHVWARIARYTSYGLWTLGYGGMISSNFIPGERKPMILSGKARRLMFFGGGLLGLGNVTSGLAVNYRGQAEEYWISERSPSGVIGDSVYTVKYITSEVFTYLSYALFVGGGVLTYMGLTESPVEVSSNKQIDNSLAFSVLPSGNGITAVVRLRLD